jgi:hypothetical protein
MNYEHNRQKYIRVQRIINIRLAKAFRTTSSEALCMVMGMAPILIKMEEEKERYKVKKLKTLRHRMGLRRANSKLAAPGRSWYNSRSGRERRIIKQVYTDGRKQKEGVGFGTVIYKGSESIAKLQFKIDNRCSNNQAEQLAIIKALEKLEVLNRQSINPLSTTIFIESRITLDSLQNYNNHVFLVEEI